MTNQAGTKNNEVIKKEKGVNEMTAKTEEMNMEDRIRRLVKESQAEDIREALYKRAMEGYVVGRAPYGYYISPDKRLEVDDKQAAVIRLIYEKYIEGYGSKMIVEMLKEMEIKTPRECSYNTENPIYNWTQSTVLRILKNKSYIGISTFGTNSKNGEVVEIGYNHEPIIPEKEFYKVQEILDMRKPPIKKISKVKETSK